MTTKNDIVIYTVNIGNYDTVHEPTFVPPGCDMVCFSDADVESKHWDIKKVDIWNNDIARTSRIYKILPHRFLSGYTYSLYIDANLVIRGDVRELFDEYLKDTNIAMFAHKVLPGEGRDCVYKEAEVLMEGKNGVFKDNPETIKKQVDTYREEGYPENNGLISGMAIVRRHNTPDVVTAMDLWWNEVKNKSKRDQLSFNYIAWKRNLSFTYIMENSRDNPYFYNSGGHGNLKKERSLISKIKNFIS